VVFEFYKNLLEYNELYGMSYSIICLVFSNTLIDSCNVYLPVAISNCFLNWFKCFLVSCITFSKLLSAECGVFWSETDSLLSVMLSI